MLIKGPFEVERRPPTRGPKFRVSVGYVYILIDPRDHSVRWVGGTRSIGARASSHRIKSIRGSTPYHAWRRELIDLDMIPTLQVVDHVLDFQDDYDKFVRQLRRTERKWMECLMKNGCPLLNVIPPAMSD